MSMMPANKATSDDQTQSSPRVEVILNEKNNSELLAENQKLKEGIIQRTNEANETIQKLVNRNRDLEKTNKEYLRFIQMLSEELVQMQKENDKMRLLQSQQ